MQYPPNTAQNPSPEPQCEFLGGRGDRCPRPAVVFLAEPAPTPSAAERLRIRFCNLHAYQYATAIITAIADGEMAGFSLYLAPIDRTESVTAGVS